MSPMQLQAVRGRCPSSPAHELRAASTICSMPLFLLMKGLQDLHTVQFICLFNNYTPLSSSLALSFPEIILTPISIKENIRLTSSITS